MLHSRSCFDIFSAKVRVHFLEFLAERNGVLNELLSFLSKDTTEKVLLLAKTLRLKE
jgi:hypothetical protein